MNTEGALLNADARSNALFIRDEDLSSESELVFRRVDPADPGSANCFRLALDSKGVANVYEADDTLLVRAGIMLKAIDVSTGRERWSRLLDVKQRIVRAGQNLVVHDSPSVSTEVTVLRISDGEKVASWHTLPHAHFDHADNRFAWSTIVHRGGAIGDALAHQCDFPTDGPLCVIEVVMHDVLTGKRLGRVNLDAVSPIGFATSGQILYAAVFERSQDGEFNSAVMAVDVLTGTVLWRTSKTGCFCHAHTTVSVDDDEIHVASCDYHHHILNRHTGKEKVRVGVPSCWMPVVGGNGTMACPTSGSIVALPEPSAAARTITVKGTTAGSDGRPVANARIRIGTHLIRASAKGQFEVLVNGFGVIAVESVRCQKEDRPLVDWIDLANVPQDSIQVSVPPAH